MPGRRDRHARDHDPKRIGTLVDRLELMFAWYKGMVDERTGRLLYLYDPENDVATGDGEPIRDIAAVWDVEVVSAFLGRDDLRDLIRRSLDHFGQLVVERDGYAMVAPRGEPSSIAHSAFLALALARSRLPDTVRRLTQITDGILRQQREDASFKISSAPSSSSSMTESSRAASTIVWRAGPNSRHASRLPAGSKGSPMRTRSRSRLRIAGRPTTGDVSGPRSASSSAHSGRPAAPSASGVASGARSRIVSSGST